MADITLLIIAAVAGSASAGLLSYFVFYSKARKVKIMQRDSSGSLRLETVSEDQLERSRREMRALMFEKDLLSSALMKLYEAEAEGRITKEERDMIAKRYSEQIKQIQSKIRDIELIVEVGELERLRDELITLFKEKIQNIEARLEQARERLGIKIVEEKKEETVKVQQEEELEKIVERKEKEELTEAERRVKQIRDEVMEALAKLEELEVQKKQEKE